jgi:hypothetical protein
MIQRGPDGVPVEELLRAGLVQRPDRHVDRTQDVAEPARVAFVALELRHGAAIDDLHVR